MAHAIPGRVTARTDEPFVVFIIGMWLPLHKDPEAVDHGLIRAWSDGMSQNAATGRFE